MNELQKMPRQYEEINKSDSNFTEIIKKEVTAKFISVREELEELRKDLEELSDYGEALDIIRNRNAFIGFFTSSYDVKRLAEIVFKLVNLEKRLTNFVLFLIIAIMHGVIEFSEIEKYLQELKRNKKNDDIINFIEEKLMKEIKEILKSAEMFNKKFYTIESNLKIIFERLTRNEQTTKKNIESIHKIESDLKGVSETLSKVEELVRKTARR